MLHLRAEIPSCCGMLVLGYAVCGVTVLLDVIFAQKRLSILTTTAVEASHCTSGLTYH